MEPDELNRAAVVFPAVDVLAAAFPEYLAPDTTRRGHGDEST
jgi:hypothetical protein